jgi:hypothetical protein
LIATSVYCIQIIAVTVAYLVPEATAYHGSSRYEIKRGYGWSFDYLPLVGIAPLITVEPCRLVITDQQTGSSQVRNYDLTIDVYNEYPQVWPEQQ